MTTDAAMLSEVPLFALLGREERGMLAELMTTAHVERGDVIFSYGDPGDSLYIIRKGRVQIFVEDARGQRIVLAENGPGELFGEISLLDGGARTAGVQAMVNTEVLVLDRDDLLEFITRRPPAALCLLTVMGQRLRSTNELLRTHASRNANKEEEGRLTVADRAAGHLAGFLGSWGFLLALAAALGAGLYALDRMPGARAFSLPLPHALGLAVGALVAFQASVLLMMEQRRAAKERLRADLDYEVNLKTELEVAQLLRKVDGLRDQLQARMAEPERRLR